MSLKWAVGGQVSWCQDREIHVAHWQVKDIFVPSFLKQQGIITLSEDNVAGSDSDMMLGWADVDRIVWYPF
jgi:hypothetical protein